MKQQAINGRAE